MSSLKKLGAKSVKRYLICKWGEKLAMPLSRPIPIVGIGVHEIRVKDRSGVYRVFYLTVAEDGVYIFHAFKKTTQATPKREIDLGKKRLQEML